MVIVDEKMFILISLVLYVLMVFFNFLKKKFSLPKFLFFTISHMSIVELLNISIIPIIAQSPQSKFNWPLLPFLSLTSAMKYAQQYDSAKLIQQQILSQFFYVFALSFSSSFSLTIIMKRNDRQKGITFLGIFSVSVLSIVLAMCGLTAKSIDTAVCIFSAAGTYLGFKIYDYCKIPIDKIVQ